MADNSYQVEKVINGKKYVAQFIGISAALQAVDSSYISGTNNTSVQKMAEYLFKHIIIEPQGLTPDSFDTMEEFNAVVEFARMVMQGDFRDKKDEKPAKAKSEG